MRRPRAAVVIFALALLMRAALFLAAAPWDQHVEQSVLLFNDAKDYHRLALTLLDHSRYSPGVDAPLEALPPPLYPLFVALIYALVGPLPWAVILVQTGLDSLSAVLLYLAARRPLGETAARIAAFVYALDPLLLLYCNHLLSDTLFVFLIVLASFLLSAPMGRPIVRRPLLWIAAAGMALGAAALTRPIGLYLPVVVLPLLLLSPLTPARLRLKSAAVVLVTFLLCVSAWMGRNYFVFGTFSFSTSAPYNLLVLTVAPMESARTGEPLGEARQRLLREADALMPRDSAIAADPFVRARYQKRLAMDYITRAPLRFARQYVRGLAYLFVNLSSGVMTNMIERHPGRAPAGRGGLAERTAAEIVVAATTALFLIVVYGAAAYGAIQAIRPGRPYFLVVCAALALYFVLLTGAAGMARFRVPIVPFYAVFAGRGLWHILGKKS